MNRFIVAFAIFAVMVYLFTSYRENFLDAKFVEFNDTQFKGINLLGLNSNDTDIPCRGRDECRFICASKEECVGYSYYAPGQRCYIYGSGDFVKGMPGYQAGKKF